MTDGFQCMLCGASDARIWLENCPDYYLQKGAPVNYVECTACSLVQQHPLPVDVASLYADYPVHTSRSLIQRIARRVFQRQVYFRPPAGSNQLALLDYGCGDGTLLREVQRRFGTCCGFEPGEAHAETLSKQLNLSVYSSSKTLCAERAGTLDVITTHYVLEHVSDLRGAFETFRMLLKPNGILYLAVPNIRSWEAGLFKQRWHGLDAPRHLVFPDKKHFAQLASEYGFTIEKTSFATFPNTLAASIATVLSGRCHSGLLMGFILPSWLIALLAPQGTLTVRMIRKD